MSKRKAIPGTLWEVVGKEEHTPKGRVLIPCRCTGCGTTHKVAKDNLDNGRSKGCGDCRRAAPRSEGPTARGNMRLYRMWSSYAREGWESFASFVEWAEKGGKVPSTHVLYRKNEGKPHGPKNSFFGPPVSAMTRQIDKIAELSGESVSKVRKWATSVSRQAIHNRLKALQEG